MSDEYPPAGFDYLGEPVPLGYRGWSCHACSAVCIEAMQMCQKSQCNECGFDQDKPESNGRFGFMVKI